MSLHVLANHMASKGRDGDSMLVHMTPGEVHGLQALAMKHGGSLTINPDTGLPEANFLKSLLPIIAGFALGPAGFGIAQSAMGAAAMVGGITGIATGSLSKGLMAGLGAYGGFGIGEGLIGAGAGTAAGNAAALGVEGAATGAGSQSAMLAQQNAGFGAEGLTRLAESAKVATGAAPSTSGMVSAGFDAASKNPLAFAKDNWKPIAAAALPVLGAIGTTTPGPSATPMAPGRIREKRWNGQYFEDVADTDASVYNTSGRSFSDLYRGYNGGGIVALADGGIPGFAGDKFSFVRDASGFDQDTINKALATELGARGGSSLADIREYAKTGYKLSDAQINAALDTIPGFNAQGTYDAADYMATSKPGQVSPQIVVDAANAANPFSAQNMAKVDVTRPGHYVNDASGNPVALTNYSPGFDINNPTALTYLGKNSGDSKSQWFQQNATPEQKAKASSLWEAEFNRLKAEDIAAGRIPDPNAVKPPTGLTQLNADVTKPPANETPAARDARLFAAAGGDWNKAAELRAKEDAALVADPNYWTNKAGLAALPAGASSAYKWHAERGLGFTPVEEAIDNWFDEYTDDLALLPPDRQVKVMQDALNTENMNEADLIKATGKTIKDWIQIKTGDIKKVTPTYLPPGVSGGSDTVINDNGTVTTRPDIPRPESGLFGGMKDVRDVYTEGGGSLGYTSPTFDTIDEFTQQYVTDRMGGDSLDAYNYLTGKGGAKYPTKSGVGRIAEPYDEAVLGYPARGNLPFTYDKATGKMVRNMDYVATGRDEKGNVTYGMSLNDIKKALTDTPLSGQALYDWAMTNKLSAQQIADATGRSLSSVYADFRKGSSAAATKDKTVTAGTNTANVSGVNFDLTDKTQQPPEDNNGQWSWDAASKKWVQYGKYADGGMTGYAIGGGLGSLGSYSDGGRLLRGPGDGVSDSIPATIGRKQQPARLADGEFVVPARIVSELGNGSTDAGAKKLYAMMDRVQRARGKTTGKNKVAANSRADKYLPA